MTCISCQWNAKRWNDEPCMTATMNAFKDTDGEFLPV